MASDFRDEVLVKHWTGIKENLIVGDELLARLVQDEVITHDQKEDIKACALLLYWLHFMS
jgi:hypothetical protein